MDKISNLKDLEYYSDMLVASGLTNTGAGPNLTEINTSAQAAFQGKKTFQVQIEGDAHQDFELHSITLTYRDLGVH